MKALLLTGYVDTMHEVAGMMEKLHTLHTYDLYIGSATASVLVALAAIDEFDTIVKLLENIHEKRSLFARLFKKRISLKQQVKALYTIDNHLKVIVKNVPVYVPLLNLTTGLIDYKNIAVLTYPDAVAVLMVSVDTPCDAVPFKMDEAYYITACTLDNMGFNYVIEQEGIDHIDMIVPRKRDEDAKWLPTKSAAVERVFTLINSALHEKDQYEISVISDARDLKTSLYFLDSEVVEPQ